MKFPSNRLDDTIKVFKNHLKDLYPENEINSFLYLSLNKLFGFSKIDLFVNRNQTINESDLLKINSIIKELKLFKPIQYILGSTVFMDCILNVNSSVLIPRPETEELVQWIFNENKGAKDLKILDIATGSGCIAIALKKQIQRASVYGLDISFEAIETAKENAIMNDTQINFCLNDITSNENIFEESFFDIIVSNPPYVLEGEKEMMHPNVLNFEPHIALFVPNENPLYFYESILQKGMIWLKPGGKLYVEMNPTQSKTLGLHFGQLNYTSIVNKEDLHGKIRFYKGEKPLI
ncbi:MAG: peptide chain release factor N(5)-glutamine methyltransferase [Bacteroidota bacterium]